VSTTVTENEQIIGPWAPAIDGSVLDVHDPATGRVIAQVPDGKAGDVDLAVDAAESAFGSAAWSGMMSPAARAQLLWKVGDILDAHADELAALESLHQGQPLAIARHVSVAAAAEHFRYYAGWCTKIEGEVIPNSFPQASVFNYTTREPIGVCGLITPWNFPLMIASWKLAPALACGNTAVIKPAEDTPLSTLRLAELMLQAGVPDGVVTGGPAAGAAIANHPRVGKVSFTGSTATGRRIVAASAAGNLKHVSLELGGKNPVIVLDDADIDAAVAGGPRCAAELRAGLCRLQPVLRTPQPGRRIRRKMRSSSSNNDPRTRQQPGHPARPPRLRTAPPQGRRAGTAGPPIGKPTCLPAVNARWATSPTGTSTAPPFSPVSTTP
jgi:acyl-CoA reductase-like NAD-dependent aldehyde dehydrogenase